MELGQWGSGVLHTSSALAAQRSRPALALAASPAVPPSHLNRRSIAASPSSPSGAVHLEPNSSEMSWATVSEAPPPPSPRPPPSLPSPNMLLSKEGNSSLPTKAAMGS